MTRITSLVRTLLPPPIADPLRDWWVEQRAGRELARYTARPTVPPPHAAKVAIVTRYARELGLATLIETGTYEGEMARRCRRVFRDIVTIELDPGLASRAAARLHRHANIRVVCGDSASVLPEILAGLTGPALFWLDGHYSGPGTARGSKDTPLESELATITSHPAAGHVVLIDDARELGRGDYPAVGDIERWVHARWPRATVEVREDIVRCVPA